MANTSDSEPESPWRHALSAAARRSLMGTSTNQAGASLFDGFEVDSSVKTLTNSFKVIIPATPLPCPIL